MSLPAPPQKHTSNNSTDLSKHMRKPKLMVSTRFFATSRSAHRAYKYFSSISIYHSSQRRDLRFEGIVDKIKYVKKFHVPMVLGIPNSNQMIKKIKSLRRCITHSTNTLSYLLSKGKQILTIAEYQKRAFRLPEYVLEGFLQKTTSFEGLKNKRALKCLKIGFTHLSYSALKEDLYELLPTLKALKHLCIALFVSTGEDLFPLISSVSIMKSLEYLELNGMQFEALNETLPVADLKISKLKIQTFHRPPVGTPILQVLSKISTLRELNILWPNYGSLNFTEEEVVNFLRKYDIKAPVGLMNQINNKETQNLSIFVEDETFKLKMASSGFIFSKK